MKKLLLPLFITLSLFSCKKDSNKAVKSIGVNFEITGDAKFTYTAIANKSTTNTVWNYQPTQNEQLNGTWKVYGDFNAKTGDVITIDVGNVEYGIDSISVQNKNYLFHSLSGGADQTVQFTIN